jgi:hypothetical protein
MTKSRVKKLAGHESFVGGMRNAYILGGKLAEYKLLGSVRL